MNAARDLGSESVLVIDDEEDLRNLVVFNLRQAGYHVVGVGTAADGLATAERERPALVLLDLMLPDSPGYELCRRFREHAVLRDTAVMMVTARGDEYDRVLGFEIGADDYVVKPFSVRELVMRVRALLRRTHDGRSRQKEAPIVWGGISLDRAGYRVMVDGAEVSLRRLEYKLLLLLMENQGRLFTRQELLESIWGGAPVGPRTVDTHVRRLRERLGGYGEAIETVMGFGYRLRDSS